MNIPAMLSISIGAALGALLCWWLRLTMNAGFPTIPLGTLVANILGGGRFRNGKKLYAKTSDRIYTKGARLLTIAHILKKVVLNM